MKQNLFHVVTVLTLMLLMSCGGSRVALKWGGDLSNIVTRRGGSYIGELLAVSDSVLYFRLDPVKNVHHVELNNRIVRAYVWDIGSIEIHGYSERNWLTPVLLFEAVPTVLLTIAAASADADAGAVFVTFLIPTALTYVAFEASTPSPPRFKHPLTAEKLEQLRKHSRFAQGLTCSQLEELLRIEKQDQIRELP